MDLDDAAVKYQAQSAFAAYLGVSDARGIWSWNDAPRRKARDVVAALRAAALTVEARVAA